jgi:hypothetical protein
MPPPPGEGGGDSGRSLESELADPRLSCDVSWDDVADVAIDEDWLGVRAPAAGSAELMV